MINIKSIEKFDILPDSVMHGFEIDIYLTPCLESTEILTDLHEKDVCNGIEYLIKTRGVFAAFQTVAQQFKLVSGMELKL